MLLILILILILMIFFFLVIVVVVVIGLVIILIGLDVNFRLWREGVVKEIYEEIYNKKYIIVYRILLYFW